MTHTLLKKNNGIELEKCTFTDYVREGTTLFNVHNFPFYILGELKTGRNIKRELERESKETFEYAEFTNDAIQHIFKYYLSKAQLMTLSFHGNELSDEAEALLRDIQTFWNQPPSSEKLEELAEQFAYVLSDCGDQFWHLVLRIKNQQVNVYPSSAVICPSSEKIELEVTMELIYVLSGMVPELTAVTLLEKPKKLDLTDKKRSLITRMFDEYGEATRKEMGISEEEFEILKASLLANPQT